MLTGDKVDTAINIGHSCSLLNTDMTTLRLCADEDEEDGETDNNAGQTGRAGGKGSGKKGAIDDDVVVTVERTSLELDASGVPSEGSLRG